MLETILIGVVIAVAAIILIIIIVSGIKGIKKKKENVEEINQVEVSKENVEDSLVEEKKPMKLVIAQGETIKVGSEGRIPCGEYIMESSDGEETFNVRIGTYVREYTNGASVVLTENQEITPVSTTIILK